MLWEKTMKMNYLNKNMMKNVKVILRYKTNFNITIFLINIINNF